MNRDEAEILRCAQDDNQIIQDDNRAVQDDNAKLRSLGTEQGEKGGGDFVVAIDFGGTKIAVATADLVGGSHT